MAKPLIAPVVGSAPSLKQKFGPRDTKGLPPGASSNHAGLDIGPIGTGAKLDILSPQSGTVIGIQRSVVDNRGLWIQVRGADGDFLMQHLASIPNGLKVGSTVRLGQKVGVMGATAKSLPGMGRHLHFEIRVKGVLVDPEKFYPAHGQPKPWERPGQGVAMTPKFKSRHLLLKSYFEDRKTVAATRKAGFKIKTVLSTWKGWTITESNRYYPTARLKKL